MRRESWTGLVTIGRYSIIQLTATNKSSVIILASTSESKVMKRVGNNGNKIDDIGIIDTISIKYIKIFKLTKSKNLM